MGRRRLSRRARWMWGLGGTIAVVGAVVAALVLQPWLLLIDVRVDDEIPAAASSAPAPVVSASAQPGIDPAESAASAVPSPPAPPVDILAGSFISHEHTTSGSVRVIEYADGTRQLAIEGLVTTNGPDVHVWLSAGPAIEGFDGWFTAAGYDHIDLGPIKGNLGDHLYDIPAGVDLGRFRTVDLWCVQFSVSFGAAALT